MYDNCPKCGKQVRLGDREAGWYQSFDKKHCGSYWTVSVDRTDNITWREYGKAPVRDSQVKRVYQAGWNTPQGKQLPIGEVQKLVDKIWGSVWFRNNFPNHKRGVKVKLLSNRVKKYSGLGGNGAIRLRAVTSEFIVLHELAHEVTDDKHGPKFARAMLQFIEQWHSNKQAATALRVEYRRWKVKVYRAPAVTVVMGPQKLYSPELGRYYFIG